MKTEGNEYLKKDLDKYIEVIKLIFETNLNENQCKSILSFIAIINGYEDKNMKKEGNEYLKKDLNNYIKLIKLILNQINEYHILDENVVEAKLRIIGTINGYEDSNMKTEGNEYLKKDFNNYIKLIKLLINKNLNKKKYKWILKSIEVINGYEDQDVKIEENICLNKDIPKYIELIEYLIDVIESHDSDEILKKIRTIILRLNRFAYKKNNKIIK